MKTTSVAWFPYRNHFHYLVNPCVICKIAIYHKSKKLFMGKINGLKCCSYEMVSRCENIVVNPSARVQPVCRWNRSCLPATFLLSYRRRKNLPFIFSDQLLCRVSISLNCHKKNIFTTSCQPSCWPRPWRLRLGAGCLVSPWRTSTKANINIPFSTTTTSISPKWWSWRSAR